MKNAYDPKVSIIMGIYNCELTIEKAINSIINQTYSNWELIMCDDGSVDETYNIAKKYENLDNRIIVLKNEKNMGLAYSLNKCIDASDGKYIARHDADDYSELTRLEKQVIFLEENITYGFTTCCANLFDEDGIWGERRKNSYTPTKTNLVKRSPFIHPTLMIRSELMDLVDRYTAEKYTYRTEDYDLWFKLYSKDVIGYVSNEILYNFREDRNSYNRKKFKYRLDECRVRMIGYKRLNVNKKYYIYALRPILVGLIPGSLLRAYHRLKSKL